MILQDQHTNTLYLSELIKGEEKGFQKYKPFYERFALLLEDNDIEVRFLPYTKDIWARDYMPVQVRKDRYVQFVYQPEYALRYKKFQHTITDPKPVCDAIGIKTIDSNLVIDGGNVIKGEDFLILTDRAIAHNPQSNVSEQLSVLFEIPESRIYFIPAEKGDEIGHADGMVRVIEGDRLLLNDYSIHPKDKLHFNSVKTWCSSTPFKFSHVPYTPDRNKYIAATGIYSNYLRIGNSLFLPQFGIEADIKAKEKFKTLFPECNIVPVLSTEIANEGGVLNCIGWNITI